MESSDLGRVYVEGGRVDKVSSCGSVRKIPGLDST